MENSMILHPISTQSVIFWTVLVSSPGNRANAVLNACLPELISAPLSPSSEFSSRSPSRQLFSIHQNYDLFHLVLYYMYTDKICFATDEPNSDIPTTHDAECCICNCTSLLRAIIGEESLSLHAS